MEASTTQTRKRVTTSPQQRQFAGQVAWERDLRITHWPSTTSGLRTLIAKLQAEYPPAPIADWQVDAIRERVERAIVEVPDFDPTAFSAIPDNRTDANKLLRVLNGMLEGAEAEAVETDVSSFVASRAGAEA